MPVNSVSAVPALIDALVTQSTTALASVPALANVSVYDGIGDSDSYGDYLMVGVQDPESTNYTQAGSAQQEWASVGAKSRDESGSITCAAKSSTGGSNQKQVRDQAYLILETVAAMCRATPALGVPQLLWTSFGTDVDLDQYISDEGVMALVLFRIDFRARI